MLVTISTHNGTVVAREHNIRNKKVVSKKSILTLTAYTKLGLMNLFGKLTKDCLKRA